MKVRIWPILTLAFLLCMSCDDARYPEEPSADYAPQIPEAVDLGLSVRWASFNLGAAAPEGYGDCFAWGEALPKGAYTLSSYKGDGNFADAASAALGGGWRVPSYAEWNELSKPENASWEWTRLNGIFGMKVISKVGGYEGNWIFLPAAGYRYSRSWYGFRFYGYYWASSPHPDGTEFARRVYFYSGGMSGNEYGRSFYGLSIRPVCE